MNLGDRLRELREGSSLGRREVARRVGISLTTLDNWENGLTSPSVDKLVSLSSVYGYAPAKLLEEVEFPERSPIADIRRHSLPGPRKGAAIVDIKAVEDLLECRTTAEAQARLGEKFSVSPEGDIALADVLMELNEDTRVIDEGDLETVRQKLASKMAELDSVPRKAKTRRARKKR